MRRGLVAWSAAWSLAATGCATGAPEPPSPPGRTAVVTWVYDGDSMRVDLGSGRERRVRLLGIDTPEGAEAAECGADEAREALLELAPPGTRVVLVGDPGQDDRDRYGRLLRHVEVRGRDVGAVLVGRGLAQVYVFRDEPFLRAPDYLARERSARKKDRGSWRTCWR